MHRNYLINLLNLYNPSDIQEEYFIEEIFEFINSNPNCFERSLEKGHITASSWLINQSGSHALLMHHRKIGKWFQLGGHCDGDPDVLKVAIKEAKEESGFQDIQPIINDIFDVDIHLIPDNPKEKAHYHYDIRFLLQCKKDEKLVQNRESKGFMWVGKEDILPTQNQSIIRMFNKWVKI